MYSVYVFCICILYMYYVYVLCICICKNKITITTGPGGTGGLERSNPAKETTHSGRGEKETHYMNVVGIKTYYKTIKIKYINPLIPLAVDVCVLANP